MEIKKNKKKLKAKKENVKKSSDKMTSNSLGGKILIIASILFIVALSINTYSSIKNTRKAIYGELDDRAEQISNMLIYNLESLDKVEKDVDEIIDIYI